VKEMEPYTNQKAETSITIKKQAPTQSKDPPSRWRCQTGGGIHPCLMEQRLAAIAVGTPAASTFIEISPTRHHEQRSEVSFKISGEER
jgi:hypothetical protein